MPPTSGQAALTAVRRGPHRAAPGPAGAAPHRLLTRRSTPSPEQTKSQEGHHSLCPTHPYHGLRPPCRVPAVPSCSSAAHVCAPPSLSWPPQPTLTTERESRDITRPHTHLPTSTRAACSAVSLSTRSCSRNCWRSYSRAGRKGACSDSPSTPQPTVHQPSLSPLPSVAWPPPVPASVLPFAASPLP